MLLAESLFGWYVGLAIAFAVIVVVVAVVASILTLAQRVAHQAPLATGGLEAVAEMRVAFDRRRVLIHKLLNEIPGVSCVEPEGAFYAFPSFKAALGRTIRGRAPATTLELAEVILDEVRVAIVPGEAFGAPGYARLSYALGDADVEKGVRRIGDLLAE